MIFSFEIIKFGTSQSSCFIEDDPLKGQNKGQIQARERTVTQWKLLIGSMKIFVSPICLCMEVNRQHTDVLAGWERKITMVAPCAARLCSFSFSGTGVRPSMRVMITV